MRRKSKLISVILGFSLLTAQAADKIGMTIYNGEDSFISNIHQSVEKIANEEGNVDLIVYDSKNNQGRQNDQIDNLIYQGVKVLVINLVDPEAGALVVEKAKAANIPVLFFNKDPGRQVLNSYPKAYYIGADPVQSAILQGDLIAKGWREHPNWDKNKDGKIQFVLLRGEKGHSDANARSEWVVKELLQNNIPAEKLSEAYGDWSEEKAKDIVNTWLKSPKADQVEMIISNNDSMAIGAKVAAAEQGHYLPIYGIDAIPQALVMVDRGELSGTVLNDGETQARAIALTMLSLALGNEPDMYTGFIFENRYLRIPYIAIDKSNLDKNLHP